MELASANEVETEVANEQSESPVDQSTIPSGDDVNITCPDLPSTNQHGAVQEQLSEGSNLWMIHTLPNDDCCSNERKQWRQQQLKEVLTDTEEQLSDEESSQISKLITMFSV